MYKIELDGHIAASTMNYEAAQEALQMLMRKLQKGILRLWRDEELLLTHIL